MLSCYNYGNTYDNDIAINYPSTVTTYSPYYNICPISGHDKVNITVAATEGGAGETTQVDLGRNVYGGTLNVKTGELTINKAIVNLGELSWTNSSGRFITTSLANKIAPIDSLSEIPDFICTAFKAESHDDLQLKIDGITEHTNKRVIIFCDAYKTKSRNEFAQLMNGIYLVYPLASPQFYQLTKAQVRSIVGENYIDSDTGEIEVKYIVYTDIDMDYQKYESNNGVEFSLITINRETNVYNGGDVETGAVITLQIEGVVKDPKIYNVETNEYFILDDLTLQDGDVVTINTVKKQKSVTLLRDGTVTNLIGKVRFGSTWFQLFPLDNTFIATAELYPENMLVTFTISNLFEGV